MNTTTQKTIAILGKGKMGGPLAALAEKAGYRVIVGSTDTTQPLLPAIQAAQIIVFALPFAAALEVASRADVRAALQGKLVIDITNPLTADYMGLSIGHTTSAGEEIAKLLAGATVVKAFNTLFADVLTLRASGDRVKATVLVASDVPEATQTVLGLACSFGLDAVDAGPLSNSRFLEPITEQLIQLAYGKGLGTKIGFVLSAQS